MSERVGQAGRPLPQQLFFRQGGRVAGRCGFRGVGRKGSGSIGVQAAGRRELVTEITSGRFRGSGP